MRRDAINLTFGALLALAQGLNLWILSDLRDRIGKLESLAMERRAATAGPTVFFARVP